MDKLSLKVEEANMVQGKGPVGASALVKVQPPITPQAKGLADKLVEANLVTGKLPVATSALVKDQAVIILEAKVLVVNSVETRGQVDSLVTVQAINLAVPKDLVVNSAGPKVLNMAVAKQMALHTTVLGVRVPVKD